MLSLPIWAWVPVFDLKPSRTGLLHGLSHVDDEKLQMDALCNTLQQEGYFTLGFTSANEALGVLREQKFDLLLTDLMVPEMDGLGLLRAAQTIDPNLVGIMMTGHGTIDTAVQAMKAGSLDYVLKPFDLTVVLPVFARALAMRRLRMENTELAKQVRDHVAELEGANKELEAFSYSVSHDLRAPLRHIGGYLQIYMEEAEGRLLDRDRQLLDKISSSAEQMRELIEGLLTSHGWDASRFPNEKSASTPLSGKCSTNCPKNRKAAKWRFVRPTFPIALAILLCSSRFLPICLPTSSNSHARRKGQLLKSGARSTMAK